MNKIIESKENKQKLKQKIYNHLKSNYNDYIDVFNNFGILNSLPMYKDKIINDILNDYSKIKDNVPELSKYINDNLESFVKKYNSTFNDDIKDVVKETVESYLKDTNIIISETNVLLDDVFNNILTNFYSISKNCGFEKDIDYFIEDTCNEFLNSNIDQYKMRTTNNPDESEDAKNTTENENKIYPAELTYNDSNEVQLALDELKELMKNVDGFKIKEINRKGSNTRLKKLAFNRMAVVDFFAYIRKIGFDVDIVSNGVCASYYEGKDPYDLNGKVNTIFYYAPPTVSSKTTRLKKLAEEMLALPSPGNMVNSQPNSYYVVLSDANIGSVNPSEEDLKSKSPEQIDSNIKQFNTFLDAEKWLLNKKTDIMYREVINNSYIDSEYWPEYEDLLNEIVYETRYKDGPKNDNTYKAVELSIPFEGIGIYNQWINKYNNLFIGYIEQLK